MSNQLTVHGKTDLETMDTSAIIAELQAYMKDSAAAPERVAAIAGEIAFRIEYMQIWAMWARFEVVADVDARLLRSLMPVEEQDPRGPEHHWPRGLHWLQRIIWYIDDFADAVNPFGSYVKDWLTQEERKSNMRTAISTLILKMQERIRARLQKNTVEANNLVAAKKLLEALQASALVLRR